MTIAWSNSSICSKSIPVPPLTLTDGLGVEQGLKIKFPPNSLSSSRLENIYIAWIILELSCNILSVRKRLNYKSADGSFVT
jgi:hypothetical protein